MDTWGVFTQSRLSLWLHMIYNTARLAEQEWIIDTDNENETFYEAEPSVIPILHRHPFLKWVCRDTKKCQMCQKQVPEEILTIASLILMQRL